MSMRESVYSAPPPVAATTASAAVRALATQLRHVFSRVNGYASPAEQIVTLSVTVPKTDPLLWLRRQQGQLRAYWAGRDHAEAIAMVGTADLLEGDRLDMPALQASLATRWEMSAVPVRYFGGFRFDPAEPVDAAWQSFGAWRFVLPRFMLTSTAQATTLTCHMYLPRDHANAGAILDELHRLVWDASKEAPALPSLLYREDVPDAAGWDANIRTALDAFCHTRLSKVVLARRSTLGFSKAIDPMQVLQRLRDEAPNRFHFAFDYGGPVFLGATPERLLKVEGRNVWSEAVAGTRPRGTSDADDDNFRDELLHSEKDQREHEFVRLSIKDTLSRCCETLEIHKAATDLKLSQGRHLFSPGHGRLRPDVTPLDLVEALHPTPAVGGYPHAEARDMIAELEGFDRGWYAAPVGWISEDAAEFAVAIRSGLVRGKALDLFAGAGIVRGSDPDSEWQEIEQKISDFMRVFAAEADAPTSH